MKRVISVLLAAVLLLGLTACNGNSDNGKDTKPLREVGTYEPGVSGFYQIQSEFYDYFLPLIGFGHVTVSDDKGNFSDAELIKFAMLQLSYAGEDVDGEGVTQRQIERTTTRFLGQKPSSLNSSYLLYDTDEEVYRANNIPYEIGALMALQKLTVASDGVCTAEFYRSKWPNGYGEGRENEEVKQDFLNNWHEGLDDVQRIRMTFRERDTDAYGYYIEVLSITRLPDNP